MFPNFIGYFLISQVRLDPEPLPAQTFRHFGAVFGLSFRDIQDRHLDRRQPGRQGSCIVFEQYSDKSLHRAHDRAMQHDRHLAGVVFGHIFCAQPFRHREIHLDGAALPDSADRVLQRELDLWPVKRALPLELGPGYPGRVERVRKRRLGTIPHGVRPHSLGRTRRQLVKDLLEPEIGIDALQDGDELRHFGLDLVIGAKNVAVILGKTADAHDPVQRARRFIAMARPELTVAKR